MTAVSYEFEVSAILPGTPEEIYDAWMSSEGHSAMTVQSWRTSEFADAHADSQIEVLLEPAEEGTLLTIRHTNVPDGQLGYEQSGWQESYFEPMREHFGPH
jgi:activator of HSP90 ATPase